MPIDRVAEEDLTAASSLRRPAADDLLPCDVIVCCYTEDRWDLLVAAIQSLDAQSTAAATVLVVVDYNDSLLHRAQTQWPDHRVIANTFQKGLSGARNTGVECSTAAVVAFLDDDAVADPAWLATTLAWFDDPQVLGVGAKVDPVFDGARPSWFPMEFDWVVGCSYVGLPTVAARIRNPIGAAMAFRRDLFAQHGGFRHDLGRITGGAGGCEETEFSIRVTPADGSYIVFDPEALATQWVPKQRQTLRYFVKRCYGEGLATAAVTAYAGSGSGTSAERSYATKTLPIAVLRDVKDSVLQREPARVARAGAVVVGLAVTTAGFVRGKLKRQRGVSLAPAPPLGVAAPA